MPYYLKVPVLISNEFWTLRSVMCSIAFQHPKSVLNLCCSLTSTLPLLQNHISTAVLPDELGPCGIVYVKDS